MTETAPTHHYWSKRRWWKNRERKKQKRMIEREPRQPTMLFLCHILKDNQLSELFLHPCLIFVTHITKVRARTHPNEWKTCLLSRSQPVSPLDASVITAQPLIIHRGKLLIRQQAVGVRLLNVCVFKQKCVCLSVWCFYAHKNNSAPTPEST